MNINEIKELIRAVSESDIDVFDYKEDNVSLSLKKKNNLGQVVMTENVTPPNQASPVPASADSPKRNGSVVKCPLVGTVYVAPEEGADPFVRVGDHVKKGQTLAIVEAMKLMNAIESEVDGVVTEVLIENGHTVEYGEEMFVIC